MIREAFDWLITPALPLARRSGHLAEFVAIAARRRRHAAAWAPHEARSREAVRRAMVAGDPAGTALILGAGHANDVPLRELADRFRQVVLVDVAFAGPTRRAARAFGNVVCVRHDVTESLTTLPTVRRPTRWLDDPAIGFVASVNLLSQLPNVATRHLPDAEGDRIGADLVAAHLAWLRAFRCPACLVCDAAVEILDRRGLTVAMLDPNKGVALPAEHEDWIWELAPMGEIDRDHAVRHRVVAVDRV